MNEPRESVAKSDSLRRAALAFLVCMLPAAGSGGSCGDTGIR
jgi:hypothetical protein